MEINIDWVSVLAAVVGGILVIILWIFSEKQKRDKNEKYAKATTWGNYFSRTWDDFVFALICAVIMGVYYHGIFNLGLLIFGVEEEQAKDYWLMFKENQGFALLLAGMFGTFIVKGIWQGGKFILKKVPFLSNSSDNAKT